MIKNTVKSLIFQISVFCIIFENVILYIINVIKTLFLCKLWYICFEDSLKNRKLQKNSIYVKPIFFCKLQIPLLSLLITLIHIFWIKLLISLTDYKLLNGRVKEQFIRVIRQHLPSSGWKNGSDSVAYYLQCFLEKHC